MEQLNVRWILTGFQPIDSDHEDDDNQNNRILTHCYHQAHKRWSRVSNQDNTFNMLICAVIKKITQLNLYILNCDKFFLPALVPCFDRSSLLSVVAD